VSSRKDAASSLRYCEVPSSEVEKALDEAIRRGIWKSVSLRLKVTTADGDDFVVSRMTEKEAKAG
jgi:hypothetical protein